MHQNELGDELYSEAGNDKVIKELANSGQYYAASEYAQSLFFKHRDLSNCGTNDAEIQKAMKYFDLSQKYLAKHYDLDN